jgi:hypothetical protein
MARLDHLGTTKQVAQIAACIGREFDHELLAAVVPIDETSLQEALDHLVESGLLFRHGRGSETVYRFKHALVCDVAYDGLLISRRKQIHTAIAHALANELKDRARIQPDLLALHLTRADLIDLAIPQWRTAARSAMAKNRHCEALGYVDAGLALIDRTVIEDRAEHEVRLLVHGAACHWVLTGYACKQAAVLWARVEALIDQVTDQRLLVTGLSGILACAYVSGDMQKALAAAERLVAPGERAGDIDETAGMTTRSGTGTVVDVYVDDYHFVSQGARIAFGITTGNAFMRAKVTFRDLQTEQVFGERSYNTKSSAWQGIFAPTTDRQTRAIVADVVKQINPR